jgi:hypothetical protein
MMVLPSGREGRRLALGLLIVAIGLFYAALVQPALDIYDEGRAELADRHEKIRRLEMLVAQLPELEARYAAGSEATTNGAFLVGSTDAAAGAELLDNVRTMLGLAGASFNSADTIPASAKGPMRQVGLRISAAGNLTALIQFLERAEQHRPALAIDNLDIRGVAKGGSDPAASLEISMDVFGLHRGS